MREIKRILAMTLALLLCVSCAVSCAEQTPDSSVDEPDSTVFQAESEVEQESEGSSDESGSAEVTIGSGSETGSATGASSTDPGATSTTKKPDKSSTTKKNPTTTTTKTESVTIKFEVPTYKQNLYNDTVVDMDGYTFEYASSWMPQIKPRNPTLQERIFFERKAEVEKEYNCKIKIKVLYPDTQTLATKILANDKIADVIDIMTSQMIPAVYANYLVPWDDSRLKDIIHLDDSRWDVASTALGNINGTQWGLNCTNPPEVRYCMFYNRDVLKKYGVKDDLEQLVKEGKWTFEKFREIALTTTKDVNNDGTIDVYGMMQDSPYSAGYGFVAANGGKLLNMDKTGKVSIGFDDPSILTALNFYNDLVNKDKVVKLWGHESSETTWNQTPTTDDWVNFFMSGKAAFVVGESFYGNQYFKPKSDQADYGILPLPLGPDATDYVSPAFNARLCVLTKTNTDLEKSATIFNALARPMKGYEDPNWWAEDVQLEYFREGDIESSEMYRFTLSKSQLDMGTGMDLLYSNFCYSAIARGIYWQLGTPASNLDSIKDAGYQEAVDALFNQGK